MSREQAGHGIPVAASVSPLAEFACPTRPSLTRGAGFCSMQGPAATQGGDRAGACLVITLPDSGRTLPAFLLLVASKAARTAQPLGADGSSRCGGD